MWRAFFLAVGTMLIILGVECLVIDSATFVTEPPKQVKQTSGNAWFPDPPKLETLESKKVVRPPEWIPWSLIASGAVIVLYSLTLRRIGGSA
ncbi:MAG TPA: hypothetical protein DDW52_05360 [Planctomycetaceae bacterium]|nr:hypothetical protein [Planctomycetaceae bacterium]